MQNRNGTSGATEVDALLTMLQSLSGALGSSDLLAQMEGGQRVRDALITLIERSFVGFIKNALDRHSRTALTDPTTRLKLRMVATRLETAIAALGVRQPAPEVRDAAALEQHLVALLWAVRQPSPTAQPSVPVAPLSNQLKPLQETCEARLDKAIHANLDGIAALGSIEQTLHRVQPGEIEEWREILRDAAREVIDDCRAVGADLQQARTSLKELGRYAALASPSKKTVPLTEDRQSLLQRLEAEMQRAQRHRLPLSLALLGPDNIDDIRHLVGADAARQVIHYYLENVTSCARVYDTVASCKPHKLLWLLPGAETDQGVRALRKAQERITTAHYHYAGRLRPLPTFSAAVVRYTPGEDSAHLLQRAETLVAYASRSGPRHIEWEKPLSTTPSRVP